MGCDIHAYVERRNSEGKWEFVSELGISRNYSLFAFLADVRNGEGDNYVCPISKHKGMPTDVSVEVAREFAEWDGDGHSHSHFTAPELHYSQHDFRYNKKALNFYEFFETVVPLMMKVAPNPEDVRMVFWFDN